MKNNRFPFTTALLILTLSLLFLSMTASAEEAAVIPQANSQEKTVLRVIIIPKFEIGEMAGDFPGEAQLFYEKYCMDCEETGIPHMPPTAHFYVNHMITLTHTSYPSAAPADVQGSAVLVM